MSVSYQEAKIKLAQLVGRVNESQCLNEAETRFHFIDELLTACLGWDRDHIHVEIYEDGDYSDYEMGDPRCLILEAKREGSGFEIPARENKKLLSSIPAICDLSPSAKKALEQVQGYCAARGVRYAVVCNGPQLIAFLATRFDGKSPLNGVALVVDGFEQFQSEFARIYECLSPVGVAAHKLALFLDANGITGIPEKISSRLQNYPSFRYQTSSSNQLRMIAELLLEDVTRTADVEKLFYKECYCESGALAQDALVSKNLLKTRYAALFNPSEEAPLLAPAKPKGGQVISAEILAEGLSRRPVILIGDVGVGKTSFIKNLVLIHAEQEFQNSLYIYLDLGVNAFLNGELETYVSDEIQNQLRSKYHIDVTNRDFVSNVYKEEISRFETGIYGSLKNTNESLYQIKLIEMLEAKLLSKEQHLKSTFAKISKDTKKQIIIIIDNVDQREIDLQQKAFIISQSIAQHWNAIVFLAVRPNTFHQSKRSGSLSAYPNKVFYIMPPRPELVLERRLVFALNMAEGRLPVEALTGVSLNLNDIALFFKALLYSLRKNPQVSEFLSNITGGNVRSMIDFVTKFIGSPNVDSDKIIEIMEKKREYIIPLHEFSKAALLGDYSHYDPHSSIAMNVFDVRYPDRREHFLCSLILGYLNYDASHRATDGFVLTSSLQKELQECGFSVEQIESSLRRLTNKKLIETSQRVTFEESTGIELQGELPDSFRITTIGAYHLSRWCGTFAYIDAMVFDTPIFESTTFSICSSDIESFEIEARFKRTLALKSYLDETWNALGINVPYFNWSSIATYGQSTFDSVSSHMARKSK